jgi:hypothetical protein
MHKPIKKYKIDFFMKKFIGFILLFFSLGLSVFAQTDSDSSRHGRGKKIKAIYVAYMTDELNLSETEAQRFWPVCKEYEAELKNTHRAEMDELTREEKILSVRKKYQEKFIKILGKERTNSFYRKDAEFKKKLVDRVKEMRKGKGEGKGQGGRRRQGNEERP